MFLVQEANSLNHSFEKEDEMRKRHDVGQSILEYTLVLGAVIAVVVYVLLGSGGIKEKVQSTYTKTGNTISATSSDASIGVFSGVEDTDTGTGTGTGG